MTVDCLLHVHSSFSYDCKTDLADIARVARDQGIACILMSEHNNHLDDAQVEQFVARCDELSDDTLLIIPGLELSFDDNIVHLLAYGLRRFIPSVGVPCTFDSLVAAVHAAGALAVLAHPSYKKASTRLDERDLAALDGIEIWNVKSGSRLVPTARDMDLLRRVRAFSPGTRAFAGLDWHYLHRFSRIVLRMQVSALTATAVLGNLKSGAYEIHGEGARVPSDGQVAPVTRLRYLIVANGFALVRRNAQALSALVERLRVPVPASLVAWLKRRL